MAKSKKKIEVSARPNCPLTDNQAKILCTEVERLYAEGTPVTARAILNEARASDSPLHQLFDWDDVSAGERWRLHWARQLMASIQVFEIRTGRPAKALFSVVVESPSGETMRSYHPRKTILESDSAIEQLSRSMYLRLQSVVAEAESLGLCQREQEWMRIRQAVTQNPPMSVQLREAEST